MNRYAKHEERIVRGVDSASDRFDLMCGPVPQDEPIFILSAGWRSGSTAVQRILTTDNRIIWGEPFAHSAPIRSAAEAWIPFNNDERRLPADWPLERFLLTSHSPSSLAETWIANLYPEPFELLAAQRAYLSALFGSPAAKAGISNWGVKGIRMGGGVAVFLQMLFPRARFVLLTRNPFDAFLSYREKLRNGRNERGWFFRFPNDPVLHARHFGEVWAGLAHSMQRHASRCRGPMIRYEDLTLQATTETLRRHGLDINDEAIGLRVGSSFPESSRPLLSKSEIHELRASTSVIAEELGYFGPTPTV